jgi:hypothetical protein
MAVASRFAFLRTTVTLLACLYGLATPQPLSKHPVSSRTLVRPACPPVSFNPTTFDYL